jgi:uncharacterized protein YjbI with pentapeptide repeats
MHDALGPNLRGANLLGADFLGANLRGANLQGADLREVRWLDQKEIEWTIGSGETSLGEDLNRLELWSKSYAEQVKIARGHIGIG